MLRFYLAVAVCLALISTSSWTQEKAQPVLLVAAAADLNPALHDIAQHHEKKTGIRIKLSFGASGALTQQIENGAPFDLFFSADMDYPKHLIADDQADAASLYQDSLGKLVLWVPSNSSNTRAWRFSSTARSRRLLSPILNMRLTAELQSRL
jgi:molybdate transport system substrate-binding protein